MANGSGIASRETGRPDQALIATAAEYARQFKWGFDHFTDNPQDDWRCDAISARAWRRELSDEDDEMAYEDILDDIGPCQCASCAGANYRAARGPNAQLPLSIRIALNLASEAA